MKFDVKAARTAMTRLIDEPDAFDGTRMASFLKLFQDRYEKWGDLHPGQTMDTVFAAMQDAYPDATKEEFHLAVILTLNREMPSTTRH